MNELPCDLILFICSYVLKNKDIINLLSVNNSFHHLTSKYHFDSVPVLYDYIHTLPYKNAIKNIIINSWRDVKHLHNITHLTLAVCFLETNVNLSASIQELTFGRFFDDNVPVLPPFLKKLTFGSDFNKYIYNNVLPDTLTHLTFGKSYNKPLGLKSLPKSLTFLKFDRSFNQQIEKGVLPDSITHLSLGMCYNKPLEEGVLPLSLTYLDLGMSYSLKENLYLPPSITHIRCAPSYKEIVTLYNTLPPNCSIIVSISL
jgi:hypothetical protein